MRGLRRATRLLLVISVTLALLPPAIGSALMRSAGAPELGLRAGVRLQALWSRCLLWAARVRLDVQTPLPDKAFIVASNHLSYVDIPVLGTLFAGRFVAKSEIAAWPVIGFCSRMAGTLFVDQQRRRDVVRTGAEIERTLQAGVRVLLFPEGGASRGARIERLHTSLLEPAVRKNVPCHAVALSYETPGEKWAPASTVCWWGGMGLWRHLWEFLGLREIVVRVRVAPEARTAPDRKELARLLTSDLEECFVPVRQTPVSPRFPWPEIFEIRNTKEPA